MTHLWRHIVTECCKQHTSSTPRRVDSTIELGPKEFFNDTCDRFDIPRDIGLTYHNSQRNFSTNIVTECCKQHTSSTPKRVYSTIELGPKGFFNNTSDRSDIPRDLGLTYHNSQRDFSINIVTECCKQHTSLTPRRVDSTIELGPRGFFNDTCHTSDIPRDIGLICHTRWYYKYHC